ncbi:MAG: sigma-70 family RNA polymerase sigma factor [Verrucomicrobia bacterium]|nr:sigma-70 family RNA polymerase sigma factor [Verrucomicrobiota bacterium]
MKPLDETLRTRWTLVAQLKNVDHQESWWEFFELYCRLIIGVAIKAGLSEQEAEDVLQETMASVAKHIREFEADPKRGSFRAWLLKMALGEFKISPEAVASGSGWGCVADPVPTGPCRQVRL